MKKLRKFLLRHGIGNYRNDSDAYIAFLKRKGVKIGTNVRIFQPKTVTIDHTRPSLLEIGSNVVITHGASILTHGYDWFVLQNLYHETIGSSGRVVIGDNVFLAFNCTILKGVTIGNNSIVAAGSVVTKDMPPNSVIGGVPAKVICTIEEYYHKRQGEYLAEAKAYAISIRERFGRMPVPSDFSNEFPLFCKRGQCPDGINMRRHLGTAYDHYCREHVPVYESFEHFMEDTFKNVR